MITRIPRGLRRPITVGLTALIGATGLVANSTAPAHAAGTGTVYADSTQRMTAATLDAVQLGTYSKGTKLNLTCYTNGQYHTGAIGNTGGTIWYQTSDGYWVADKDIDTGSDKPVAPACGRIDTNAWYTVASASSGQMVDLPGANTTDRTRLQQWPANGHDAQKWRFVPTSGGYYRVESKVKKGVSWDAEYGHTKNGTKMVVYGYQGAENMQWRPVWHRDGTVSFRPRHANDQCFDLPAGSKDKGAKLQTWSCNNNNAQNWRLKVAGANQGAGLNNPYPAAMGEGGGYTERAAWLRDVISDRFGMTCNTYKTYDKSEHANDNALDCWGTPDQMYKLSRWTEKNARTLQVGYVIYAQKIWDLGVPQDGWRQMEDRGSPTQNHFDHVHISMQTPATDYLS